MKAITKTICAALLVLIATYTFAQRKITGTVYKDGKPAAGIFVEGNKTKSTHYTSFDGVYEITIEPKTTTLKFTYLDETKKLDITGNTSDVIDFSFDGKDIPQGSSEGIVNLEPIDELLKTDQDFRRNYSLYRESMKQNDIKSAIPSWRLIYKKYPKSTTQIYIDGLKIYEDFLEKATDTKTKSLYLDSLMLVYDKQMKYFDNVGEVMGRKADKYLRNVLTFDLSEKELIEDIKTGNGFAEKSIIESKNKSEGAVLVLFMQSSSRLYAYNALPKDKLLENYEKVMAIIEEQLKDENYKEKATEALSWVEKIIESSGALDCAGMVDMYKVKFEANPTDVELIKKMLRLFRKQNCDNELMVKASEKLYELEPSAEAAFNMARLFLKKEDITKALAYYEKAYTQETNPEQKATYLYEAAMLNLQHGNLRAARDLAQQALRAKPDYCQAYMLIGEVYAQASKEFTDDFEKGTVFWVVVDYFRKAAAIEACKSDASLKIGQYSNYFPSKEEAFFRQLQVGQSYTVGGWINETTRVSAK